MAGIVRYSTKTAITYNVGDIGPAGGMIFMTPSTPYNTTGNYFEAAPYGWNGAGADPTRTWAQTAYQTVNVSGATSADRGAGYANTLAIIAQGNTNTATSAAALAQSCTSGGKNDWFLPSLYELSEMLAALYFDNGDKSGFDNGGTANYWSSTQETSTAYGPAAERAGMWLWLGDAGPLKSDLYSVRPVRMFKVDSLQRIGNDSVYGTGNDGTVVIASNTSLSRDMYYNNLTVNSNVSLNPNGYRIFVKNTLTLNGTIGVNSSTTVSDGTIKGNTSKATSTTRSIGGSAFGSTYTASQISSTLLYDLEKAVLGTYVDPSGTYSLTGGAGGGDGAAGTVTPAAAGSGATAGGAGGAGGAGSLNRNALAPGGPGTAGTPGTSGTNGAAGSTPPAASGGTGARGGSVVIVVAKTITGSGSIVSQGQNGAAGGSSATGNGSTNGAAGAAGTAGTAAPGQAIAHHSDGTSSYITGDGTHGHHQSYPAPNLPHGGHVPHTSQGLHHDRYVYHAVYVDAPCGDGTHAHGAGHFHTPYGHYHGYSPHNAGENTANFTAINGITHTYPHRPHSGVAYSGNTHQQHVDSSPEHHNWHSGSMQCSDYKGHHFTTPRHHGSRVGYGHTNAHRNAGTVSHVGHLHAGGGAAGAAGAAGSAGTSGTNGSTTAGGNGQSGGGGGIIIVTDAALPVGITTSVIGGVISSNSASSGTVTTILNI